MSRRRPMNSHFSISEMLGPGPGNTTSTERANGFSGIAHHNPPGGKSSIDFSFGTSNSCQQSSPWQTSSRAASAAADLSYQLHLTSNPTTPLAGRRAATGPAQGQSIIAGQLSPSPRYTSSNSSSNSFAAYPMPSQYSSRLPTPPVADAVHVAQPLSPSLYAAPFPPANQPHSGFSANAHSSSNSSNSDWRCPSSSSSSNCAGSCLDAAARYGPAGSRYSLQMQQLISQQQQQQQQSQSRQHAQQLEASGFGGYGMYGASNNVLDGGAGSGSYQGLYSYGSPRITAAASSVGGVTGDLSSWNAATAAAPSRHSGSDWVAGGNEWPATAGRSSALQGSASAAQQQAGRLPSSIPQPAMPTPQIHSSKGAFCGKVIVQPPGGRTSINIFGGQ